MRSLALTLARIGRHWLAISAAVALWFWGQGTFVGPAFQWGILAWLSLGALVVALVRSLVSSWHPNEGNPVQPGWMSAGIVVLWVHVVVQMLAPDALRTTWYLFVPLALAILSVLSSRSATMAGFALAVVMEAWVATQRPLALSLSDFVLHVGFLAAFMLFGRLCVRIEIKRIKAGFEQERSEEKKKIEQDARMFRLVAMPTDASGWNEERLKQSSVVELKYTTYHAMQLLKDTLQLHTCALFLSDDVEQRLLLSEIISDSDAIKPRTSVTVEGVVAAVRQKAAAVRLESMRGNYDGLCYYDRAVGVNNFIGVPIIQNKQVIGVLCADRISERAFSKHDEQVLVSFSEYLVHAVQNEQLFTQLERTKHQQAILYRSSQALGEALSEEAVIEATLGALQEISPHDFAAITLYDSATHTHTIRKAVGQNAEAFNGASFRNQHSLTSMAVATKHYLPYRGDYDSAQQVAFSKGLVLSDMRSLIILPLLVGERAIGTLALAASESHVFGEAVRTTLHVFANQVAVSLANAGSVRKLEELATIDGLTGCLNKRAFLEEFERRLRAAARFKRRMTLVVTDIDHFKSVNDTYGHATGDVVLKGLGELLRKAKRETDIVARFGGEEFCVLCEETDAQGAMLLAERIRKELSQTPFQTGMGTLNVTCSAGLATFPLDAKDAENLFSVADKALYAAKRSGRNRVISAQNLKAAAAASPAN